MIFINKKRRPVIAQRYNVFKINKKIKAKNKSNYQLILYDSFYCYTAKNQSSMKSCNNSAVRDW